MLVVSLRKLIKELLGKLLSSERLLQVRKQENWEGELRRSSQLKPFSCPCQELLLDQNAPENAALTVEEFLTRHRGTGGAAGCKLPSL